MCVLKKKTGESNFSLCVKEEKFFLKVEREELLEIFSHQCIVIRLPMSSYLRVCKVSHDPEKCKIYGKNIMKKAKYPHRIKMSWSFAIFRQVFAKRRTWLQIEV